MLFVENIALEGSAERSDGTVSEAANDMMLDSGLSMDDGLSQWWQLKFAEYFHAESIIIFKKKGNIIVVISICC